MSREADAPQAEVALGFVDTGFSPSLAAGLADYSPEQRSFQWDEQRACVVSEDGGTDALGHGTALASTVLAVAPGARLLMARVFFQQWSTRPAQVAAAIDWLCQSGVRVINLSLGLKADRPALREACERALAAGVILVASSPARGEAVFPAAYPGVIRATGDARCDARQISWLNTPQADIGGCVRAASGQAAGASVGAAHTSAHITRYLQNNPGACCEQVLIHLHNRADYLGPERR